MTITEGGGRRAISRKFQDVYLPALKANFMLWPMVQILNFRVIPLPFQIVSYQRHQIFSPLSFVSAYTESHARLLTGVLSSHSFPRSVSRGLPISL